MTPTEIILTAAGIAATVTPIAVIVDRRERRRLQRQIDHMQGELNVLRGLIVELVNRGVTI